MRLERGLDRLFYASSGIFLLAGGLAFIWGGSQHPPTGTSLGPIGSEEYFLNFAHHITGSPNWESIHTGILAGPLLWALGAVGVATWLRAQGDHGWSSLGQTAVAMGATAWAVTFVFDGFVAPHVAAAILAAPPEGLPAAIAALKNNQLVVIRLGLVSLLLQGAGIAALAIGCWDRLRGLGRWLLGPTGLVLGVWPLLAWRLRIFEPGPFISPMWKPTALLMTAWFLMLGLRLIGAALRGPVPVESGA